MLPRPYDKPGAMAGGGGLEPPTYGSKGRRSAIELPATGVNLVFAPTASRKNAASAYLELCLCPYLMFVSVSDAMADRPTGLLEQSTCEATCDCPP